MAIHKIITIDDKKYGHMLHEKAKKVTKFDASIERLVHDLFQTMRVAPGVGLAAPQIAVPLRVLVAEYDGQQAALINPEIVKSGGEVTGTEGCLSIPGYIGLNIRRATKITVKARNEKGAPIKLTVEGWFARVLQHEIDHLDGILYLDRLDRPEDLHEVEDDEADDELAPTNVVSA